MYSVFQFIYIFEVRGREPAVAHETGCAASWPGSTCLCGGQPTLADLSSAQKTPFNTSLKLLAMQSLHPRFLMHCNDLSTMRVTLEH